MTAPVETQPRRVVGPVPTSRAFWLRVLALVLVLVYACSQAGAFDVRRPTAWLGFGLAAFVASFL